MGAVRPLLVVEPPPAFDEELGLGTTAEPIAIEQFVARLAVEALDEAVLPRAAGRDEHGADGLVVHPAHHLGRGELSAIV